MFIIEKIKKNSFNSLVHKFEENDTASLNHSKVLNKSMFVNKNNLAGQKVINKNNLLFEHDENSFINSEYNEDTFLNFKSNLDYLEYTKLNLRKKNPKKEEEEEDRNMNNLSSFLNQNSENHIKIKKNVVRKKDKSFTKKFSPRRDINMNKDFENTTSHSFYKEDEKPDDFYEKMRKKLLHENNKILSSKIQNPPIIKINLDVEDKIAYVIRQSQMRHKTTKEKIAIPQFRFKKLIEKSENSPLRRNNNKNLTKNNILELEDQKSRETIKSSNDHEIIKKIIKLRKSDNKIKINEQNLQSTDTNFLKINESNRISKSPNKNKKIKKNESSKFLKVNNKSYVINTCGDNLERGISSSDILNISMSKSKNNEKIEKIEKKERKLAKDSKRPTTKEKTKISLKNDYQIKKQSEKYFEYNLPSVISNIPSEKSCDYKLPLVQMGINNNLEDNSSIIITNLHSGEKTGNFNLGAMLRDDNDPRNKKFLGVSSQKLLEKEKDRLLKTDEKIDPIITLHNCLVEDQGKNVYCDVGENISRQEFSSVNSKRISGKLKIFHDQQQTHSNPEVLSQQEVSAKNSSNLSSLDLNSSEIIFKKLPQKLNLSSNYHSNNNFIVPPLNLKFANANESRIENKQKIKSKDESLGYNEDRDEKLKKKKKGFFQLCFC